LLHHKQSLDPKLIKKERIKIDTSRFKSDLLLYKYLQVPQDLPKLDKKAIRDAKIREQKEKKNLDVTSVSTHTPETKEFARPNGKYGINIGEDEDYDFSSESDNDSVTSDSSEEGLTLGVRDRMRRNLTFTPTVTTNFENQFDLAQSTEKKRKKEKKKSDQLLLTASDKYYEYYEEQRKYETRKVLDATIKNIRSLNNPKLVSANQEHMEQEVRRRVEELSKEQANVINAKM
jgi:nitrate reductase alpha subunit